MGRKEDYIRENTRGYRGNGDEKKYNERKDKKRE